MILVMRKCGARASISISFVFLTIFLMSESENNSKLF